VLLVSKGPGCLCTAGPTCVVGHPVLTRLLSSGWNQKSRPLRTGS